MGLIPTIRRASFAAVALAAAPAFGQADGSCPPDRADDAVSELALDVGALARMQNFASTAWVQREQETTFDLKEATDSNGQRGKIGTTAFTPEEMRELEALESRLPRCVIEKANVVRAFRSKRGIAAEKLGIVGIAYAYNNGTYNKDPDGTAVRGGQFIITDLFLDRQAFNKRGTGDQQMQVAFGWSTCQPPRALPADQLGDVATRARSLPEGLKRLTRERILFHEYIHGVTHEQEENGYTDPNSLEGFFGQQGASRYHALRSKLYAAGAPLEQYNARLRAARSREEYCAIYGERADYLKREGVPQRWPGDTHALNDRDEYVTILIEQMMYDREGMTGYTAAEKQWAENWWNYTFNPAYKQSGPYRKIPFGTCPPGNVAGADPGRSGARPAASAFGATETYGGW